MSSIYLKGMRRTNIVLLILLISAAYYIGVPETRAQGGSIAASGTFSGWQLEIPQGSEAGGLDRFLVVFNNSGEILDFTAGSQGPAGIGIEFSEPVFTLEPGGQKRLSVAVIVSEDAVPGIYDLRATVTARASGAASGVGVSTGIAQKARVTVIGDSAVVDISVVSPQGQPVVADVRLFREFLERKNEVGYSGTGSLESRVSPGDYTASAYVGGESIAEESFSISVDEIKEIEFVVRTVFISDVTVTPHYRGSTTELSFVTMTYSLNNLGSPATAAEVILKVSKDNVPLEEASILTLDTLEIGATRGSHNYIPQAGWVAGSYRLAAALLIEGRPYTSSLEAEITAGPQRGGGLSTETPAPPTAIAATAALPTPTLAPTPSPNTKLEPTSIPEPKPESRGNPAAKAAPSGTGDETSSSVGLSSVVPGLSITDISSRVSELGVVQEKVVLVSLDRLATLEISEGTLALGAEGQALTALEIRPAVQPIPLPKDTSLIGVVYEFGPSGATFSPPVSVSLGYAPAELSAGDAAEDLMVLRYDNSQGWLPLETSVDAANAVAGARTSHFSQFALAALQPSSSSDLPMIVGVIGAAAAVVLVIAFAVRFRSRQV